MKFQDPIQVCFKKISNIPDWIYSIFLLDEPVEELYEKDAIPLGEREDDSLELPTELPAVESKVLTTPAVRKMANDHKVNSQILNL